MKNIERDKEKAPITFESESELNETINQLVHDLNESSKNDPGIAKHIYDVNKMFQLFKEIYRKNLKLLATVQELNTYVVVNASKIALIKKTTDSEKGSLSKLKDEFEEAAKMVTFSHEAENKSKEILMNLRQSIEELREQVNKGDAFTFGEGTSVFEISQDVKNLEQECKKGQKEIMEMTFKINTHKSELEKMKKSIRQAVNEAHQFSKTISGYDDKIQILYNDIESINNELVEIKPIVPDMKEKLDSKMKEKLKLNKSIITHQQDQVSITTVLFQARDESKAIKEKCSRKQRTNNDVKQNNQVCKDKITNTKKKIENADEELNGLKNELENITKQNQDLHEQYEESLDNIQNISNLKQECRKEIKSKRPEKVFLKKEINRTAADAHLNNKKLMSANDSVMIQTKLLKQEERATDEIINSTRQAKNAIRNIKPHLQHYKDKYVGILREIDHKRTDKFKTSAQMEMIKENIRIIKEDNDRQLNELMDLNEKIIVQESLSEDLRKERNIYKRKFEDIDAENINLSKENDKLDSEIQELQAKYANILRATALAHVDVRSRYDQIKSLKSVNKNLQKTVQGTERIISRLRTECLTMVHVLQDSQNDHILQSKERELLVNNQRTLIKETNNKKKKIEELRDQIKSTEAYLKKSATLYKEKENEIKSLMITLKQLEKTTSDLEKKAGRLSKLEMEMHRLATMGIIEKQKAMSLIHEFSVPLNVHRWKVIGAVNQPFIKNIQFRTQLSIKLDEAHKEHIRLREEKEKLEQEYKKMREELEKNPSKEKIQNAINNYILDIKRKDKELAQMKKEYYNNLSNQKNSKSRVAKARSSLNQKRGDALAIKNEISTALQYDTPPIFYITENPLINPMLGGGFSLKANNNITRSVPKSIFSPSQPNSKNTKRFVPSILNQTPSSLKYHGLNFQLPSMS